MGLNFNLLSSQALRVYKTLLERGQPTTAKSLGGKLNIFPNSVYRAVKELEEHSLVEIINGRPLCFQARSADEAVDQLFFPYRERFLKYFSTDKKIRTSVEYDFGVSFIHSRNESIERSTEDLKSAKAEYFLIVSGDEVPAEVILTNKKAMGRGVDIRIIVQRFDEGNKEMIINWQRLGMGVRFSPTIETRVTIVDSKIVYLVSYDPKDYKKGVGVRFAYQPVASLMRDMFMQKWREAKRI
ncbi:hypothetical protein A2955_02995 [Candidatus Woesebacteria bacterium RIFCSPLOWO2_01_FULL_37_19]|uniref:Transcription regulator TrmB N-terminal domain-containing protein n=1 Tax=Candidatus Woesebacteria bacterium RIFCSPLOWO2_01_FULL_37_19 TaxID=1802514 RepID=A0A1F8BDN7_9BACT|nr:MAG: hypothetical protein A2955_02995 [Candidatus Woesebacteria bacterium RIFCSPLOWO2_01_FULL_37_19]